MCADKFRKTQPTNITFSDGEQPTASKLTALNNQSRSGSDLLEKAIGDIWNQNGDALLINTPLQIPNLARMVGQNQYLNPALYPFTNEFEFDDHVGAKYTTETTGFLTFRPKSGSSYTSVVGTAFSGSQKSNEYEVGDPNNGSPGANEWYVSESTGKFRVDTPLSAGTIVRYEVDPTVYDDNTEILPGVIPDPRQETFTSCRIEKSGTDYYLHLPPRRPLVFASSGYEGSESRPTKYPTDTEINDSNNSGSGVVTLKYWQDTTTALDHEHYRYHLPKEMLDVYASMNAGDEFPEGHMYIWNTTDNTIIDDVVFSKSAIHGTRKWILKVESSLFDFDTVDTVSEAEGSYSSTNLILITCGSPLARSIWAVLSRQLKHTHDNTDTVSVVNHGSLIDLNPPESTHADHTGRYPSGLPRWSPSRWAQDDHTSLLSRGGSYGSAHASRRDPNDNAMLGDFVLANSVKDADNVFLDATTPDESFRIRFGDIEGSHIYQDSNADLQISGVEDVRISAIGNIVANMDNAYFIGDKFSVNCDEYVLFDAGAANFIYHQIGGSYKIELSNTDLLFKNLNEVRCNTNLIVGVDDTARAKLHVYTDITGITPHANADEVLIEGGWHTGITIAGGNSAQTSIYFEENGGTPGDSGKIVYDHNNGCMDFYGETNKVLTIDGSNNKVGIGTDAPDVKLHVYTSDTSITPHASADEFFLESAAATGMTIASAADDVGSIYFEPVGGTPGSHGRIVYDHDSSPSMTIYSENDLTINLAAAAGEFVVNQNSSPVFEVTETYTKIYQDVNITDELLVGNDLASNAEGSIHVYDGDAGTFSANADADQLVLENAGNSGMTILGNANSSCSIFFDEGGQTAGSSGKIIYDHSTDKLNFYVGGAQQVEFSTTDIQFDNGSTTGSVLSDHSKSQSIMVGHHGYTGPSITYTNSYISMAAGTRGYKPIPIPAGATITRMQSNVDIQGAGTTYMRIYRKPNGIGGDASGAIVTTSTTSTGNITMDSGAVSVLISADDYIWIDALANAGGALHLYGVKIDYTFTNPFGYGESCY